MIQQLAEFFGIIGLDLTPPETFSELIPYLLQVFLAFALVSAIFGMFRAVIYGLTGRGRGARL